MGLRLLQDKVERYHRFFLLELRLGQGCQHISLLKQDMVSQYVCQPYEELIPLLLQVLQYLYKLLFNNIVELGCLGRQLRF